MFKNTQCLSLTALLINFAVMPNSVSAQEADENNHTTGTSLREKADRAGVVLREKANQASTIVREKANHAGVVIRDNAVHATNVAREKKERAKAYMLAHPYYTATGAAVGAVVAGVVLHRVIRPNVVVEEPSFTMVKQKAYSTRTVKVLSDLAVTTPGQHVEPVHFGLSSKYGSVLIDGAVLDASFKEKGSVITNSLDGQSYLFLRRSLSDDSLVAIRINETGAPEAGAAFDSIYGGAEGITDQILSEYNPWEPLEPIGETAP